MNDSLNNTRRPIRVLVFSNYLLVRECLKGLLETHKDIIVSQMLDAEPALTGEGDLNPGDVAVIYFENGDSLEIVSAIQSALPGTRVVAIISGDDLDAQVEAVKLGATGVVKRDQNFRFLIEAVRQTAQGEVWLNQGLLSKIINNRPKGAPAKNRAGRSASAIELLTAREIEVIEMIGEGLKNKAIADRLAISEATVRHHLSSIYGKLGVEDRLNLVITAYQQGLIQLTQTITNI